VNLQSSIEKEKIIMITKMSNFINTQYNTHLLCQNFKVCIDYFESHCGVEKKMHKEI
jgi:hypothetical protein